MLGDSQGQILQNMDIYIQLQSLLFSLNVNTFEENMLILASSIFGEDDFISSMAHQALLMIDYRPRNITLLVQLLKVFPFPDKMKQKNIEILTKTVFELIASSPHISNSRLFFVYKCFNEKLIPVDVIIQKLQSTKAFLWFAPQFEEFHPNKYYEFLTQKEGDLFISLINEMKKDNWSLHRQLACNGVNHTKIANLIRSDDLDVIKKDFFSTSNDVFDKHGQQMEIQEGMFNVNMRMPHSSFESVEILSNGCTLLQYSAYYNSVKCFLFFLNNGSSLFATDRKGLTTINFAIAGGAGQVLRELLLFVSKNKTINDDSSKQIDCENKSTKEKNNTNENNSAIEINDFYDNKFCPNSFSGNYFTNSDPINENLYLQTILIGFSFSALYHQNNIFTYLETIYQNEENENSLNHPKQIKENIDIFNTSFLSAVTSDNMKLVKYLIDKGIDVNCENHHRETALIIASSNGHFKLVSFFLTFPNINVAHSDYFGRNALICAVDSRNLEIVKLLVKDNRIDINSSDVQLLN